MIRHYLKLTWNKKKKHLVFAIELFFAYLVTSFLVLFLFSALSNSFDTPQFSSDNLIHIRTWPNDTLKQNISAIREVKSISQTNIIPYRNIITGDSVQYGDTTIRVYKWDVDEKLFPMMKLSMSSGRQFNAGDRAALKKPVIISEALKDQLFSSTESEGRVLKINTLEYNIIGVVKDLHDPSGNYHNRPELFTLDSGNAYLVKLNTPMDDNIYRKLKRVIPGPQEFNDNITPIKEYQDHYANKSSNIIILIGGLCGFLIINVVLGLFSMLYQNINRRRSEIGLRRSSGATAGQIYKQIVSEVVLLATITMIPGIIIASQFALFQVFGEHAVYYPSMLIGAGIIYILVILCALYPAALASRIQPAEALHEE